MVAGYDICNTDELKGLKKALLIASIGWVGSDGAYDTVLSIKDGQATPVEIHNSDTVANGLDFSKHVRDVGFSPRSGEISIEPDVNLGAGDCVIFIDAVIPDA
jgi:hypothetical protein